MSLRVIALAVCGAALLPPPAAGQSPRYSDGWRPPEQTAAPARPKTPPLHRLLRDLDKLTSRAARDKAAHPRLLSDMRALARRYAQRWPRVVLKDPFLDGNLTANPRWFVESGQARVGRRGLIIGERAGHTPNYATPAPAPAQEAPESRFGDSIFGSLLEELTRDRESESRTPDRSYDREPAPSSPEPPAWAQGEGRLRTQVGLPNAFTLRVALRSRRNSGGSFVMGVGQGARADGYRLIYRPAGSPALSLVRVGARGTKTLGSVFEPVRLEDHKLHKLELSRDILREVTVKVDGKLLLRQRDTAFRDDFDSVLLHVSGGTYVVRAVVAAGTP